MPALSDVTGLDLQSMGYTPSDPTTSPIKTSISTLEMSDNNLEPGYNRFLRCPIPPVWQASPDSLRQFYRNNTVPQTRLFNTSSS